MSGTTEPAAASASNVANTTTSSTTLGTATSTQSSSFDSETKSILRSPKLGQPRKTTSSNQSVSGRTATCSFENMCSGLGGKPSEEKAKINVFLSTRSRDSVVPSSGNDGSPKGSTSKFGCSATFDENPVVRSTFSTTQRSSNTSGGFEKYAASGHNFGNLAQISNTPTFGSTAQQSSGFSSSTQEQTGSDGSTQEQTKSGFGSDTKSSNSFRPEFTEYRSNMIIEQTPSSNQSVSRPTGYNPFEEKPNANVFKFTQSGVSDVTNPGHDGSPMGSIHKFGGGATFGGNPVGGSTFGTPQQSSNTSGGFEKYAASGHNFGNLAQISNTPTFGSTAQQSSGFSSSTQEQTGSDGSTQEQTKSGFGSDTKSSNSFRPEFTEYRSNMIIEQTPSSNQSVSRPTGYNPFEEKPNANVFKFTQSGVSDVTNPGHDGSPMGSIHKFGGGATFGGNPVGGSTFGTPQQSSNTSGGFEKYAASGHNFGNLAQISNTPTFGSTAQQSSGFSSSTQEQTGSDGSTQEQTKSGFGGDTNSSYGFRPEFTEYRSNMIIEQTPSSNQSVSRPTGFNPFKEKPNANVFKFTQSGVSDVTNPGHDRSPMGSIHKFGGGATFGGNPVGGSTFGTPQQSSNTSGGFEKSAELCPTFGSLALSSNTPIFGSTAQQSAGFSSSAQEQTGSDGSTQEQTKSGFGGDTNSSYGFRPEFTEYRSNMIIEQTPSSNQSVSRPTGFNPFKEKPNANVFKFTQSGVSDVTNPGHDRSPMGSIHKFGGGATFGGNPVGGSTFGTPQQSSNTSGGFEKSAELCPTFGSLALSSNTPIFGSTAQQSAGFSSSAQEQTGSDGSTQEQTKSGFGGDTNSSYGSGPRFTEYRS